MEFLVSVLRVPDSIYKDQILKLLEGNATYVERFDVWLFEGDWEFSLREFSSCVTHLTDIVVPSLGGMSQEELERLVEERLQEESVTNKRNDKR